MPYNKIQKRQIAVNKTDLGDPETSKKGKFPATYNNF